MFPKIYPTPIGFKPKLLSNRTNPKSKKGSTLQVKNFSVQIFSITYAMALYKPAGGSLKLFDSSICPQPLEFILDGPYPLPYFRAVFHTSLVLIESSCMWCMVSAIVIASTEISLTAELLNQLFHKGVIFSIKGFPDLPVFS